MDFRGSAGRDTRSNSPRRTSDGLEQLVRTAFEDIVPHSAVSFFGRLSATQAGRYAFAGQIDEWKILKTAAKIVSEGFRDAGYVYINLVLLRMP